MRPLALTDPYGGRFPDPEPEETEVEKRMTLAEMNAHFAIQDLIGLHGFGRTQRILTLLMLKEMEASGSVVCNV